MMKRMFAAALALAVCLSALCVFADDEGFGEAALGEGPVMPEEGDFAEASSSPFVPEGAEKRIVYSDDRVSVDVRAYPYRAIAYIETHARCGCRNTGTGFMVGPSGLITAGHVLYCAKHDSTVDGMTLYFGYRSNKNYVYRYNKGTTYWYNYTDRPGSEEYDYGYVKLQERVGDRVGWFGVSVLGDEDCDAEVFYAAGYRHGVLKQDYDFAYVSSPYQLRHKIDTEPGYSGCPLFNDEYYAVAINVAESLSLEENYACRITNRLFTSMKENGIFD